MTAPEVVSRKPSVAHTPAAEAPPTAIASPSARSGAVPFPETPDLEATFYAGGGGIGVAADSDALDSDALAGEAIDSAALRAGLHGVNWRDAVVAWAAAALSPRGTQEPPPVDEATPLGLVARRFALGTIARHALALLYGSWLLGDGARGLPAASIARSIDGARGLPAASIARAIVEDTAWPEALGRGALARAGLTRSRHGRTRLSQRVGRLLDGQPPRTRIEHPATRSEAALLAGPTVVQLAPFADAATVLPDVAGALGRAVALIDLRDAPVAELRRRLERALVEARLFDAVPLVVVPAGDEAEWLADLAEAPALIALTGSAPSSLAALPRWRLDADDA